MATLEELTGKIREGVGEDSGLKKTLKFDFGADGKIYIDGVAVPNTVSNEDLPADCTVAVKFSDFIAMSEGKLDAMMAFMQGKMRVQGDMTVAQKLTPILKKLQ
ncbi:SCP2 sterol-binding domain-containing protein [Novosphingobium aquae]|uniref:SCP2 sterol-binding domain-containing protein n=1 Tax=Novosphingobium aquae TaxID=3133435 RepID=A0ABU8SAB6_9SPHN